ncbi:hypothetical protein [Thermus sp. NMX2.A1]|uniref:hypothetical protein n=1 Tax=Thermus sp. NMX2.A1 TaxID=570924 RepID=UPI000410F7AA|nr:hypothetical protein [Thermus sp. NMX2.A1]
MSAQGQEKPLQVNLFPLRVDLEALRIFRFRTPEPLKIRDDLRDTGWYAFAKGKEVWVYGLEAPKLPFPLVGVERPRNPQEQTQALNSHLNQRLLALEYVRVGPEWLDPQTHMAAEGVVAEGPFKGHPLVLASHPVFRVEVVRLEQGFFALVDMEHRVLTKDGIERIPNGLLEYFQSLAPEQPLGALDLEARKELPLTEAPPRARLLLHPAHQAALEAPAAQGRGARRLSKDTFAGNQFRFNDLLKHASHFADFLDPSPLTLPLPLERVSAGRLRMARGVGLEAKEVNRLAFLGPQRVRVLLAFPEDKVVKKNSKPAGHTGNHIHIRTRGEGEYHVNKRTFVEETPHELSTRELLLYHFVDRERLQNAKNEKHVLAAMWNVPSLIATWRKWGLDLEPVRPPVKYAPTGEVLEGGSKRNGVDVAVILAPESVKQLALDALKKKIRRDLKVQRVQVVNPDTLLARAEASSFAYHLAVRAGALPFKIEGFSWYVLGLRKGKNNISWRLLEPGGQPVDEGPGFPGKEEELPPNTLVHYRGERKYLKQVQAWTKRPVIWIQESHLRFSMKELPLRSYFRPLPEVAYLHTHSGNPGWPRALRVEVVQGDVPLEEVLAQVYWLTKPAGGLYNPGKLPLSVVDETSWPRERKKPS